MEEYLSREYNNKASRDKKLWAEVQCGNIHISIYNSTLYEKMRREVDKKERRIFWRKKEGKPSEEWIDGKTI